MLLADFKIYASRSELSRTAIAAGLKENYEKSVVGFPQAVLWENCVDETKNIWVGHTPNNLVVKQSFPLGVTPKNTISLAPFS